MKTFAIIESGRVTNVAISNSPITPEWVDLKGLDPQPGPGWSYAGGVFSAPVVPIEPVSRILTHLGFRRLFTLAEREAADELEATFEASTALTAAQKRTLRSGYKDFNAASEVNLDDPGILPMLALYVALGILASSRPAEILA